MTEIIQKKEFSFFDFSKFFLPVSTPPLRESLSQKTRCAHTSLAMSAALAKFLCTSSSSNVVLSPGLSLQKRATHLTLILVACDLTYHIFIKMTESPIIFILHSTIILPRSRLIIEKLSFHFKWFLPIPKKMRLVASETWDMMGISKPDSCDVTHLDFITVEMNDGRPGEKLR